MMASTEEGSWRTNKKKKKEKEEVKSSLLTFFLCDPRLLRSHVQHRKVGVQYTGVHTRGGDNTNTYRYTRAPLFACFFYTHLIIVIFTFSFA